MYCRNMTWTMLFLRTLCDTTYTISASDLLPSATVLDLKALVEARHGLPAGKQQLIYCGMVLQDEDLVASHRLQDGTVIHLVNRESRAEEPDRALGPDLAPEPGLALVEKQGHYLDTAAGSGCLCADGLDAAADNNTSNDGDSSDEHASADPHSSNAVHDGLPHITSDRVALAAWVLETALWIRTAVTAWSIDSAGSPPARESHRAHAARQLHDVQEVTRARITVAECAVSSAIRTAEKSVESAVRAAEKSVESAVRAAESAVEAASCVVESALGPRAGVAARAAYCAPFI